MMSKVFFLLLFVLLSAGVCKAQLPDSLKAHIDTAFSLMQRSLYSHRVNWKAEKAAAYKAAKNVATKEALFPVIAAVYKKLDDRHGWFEQYNDKLRLPPADVRQPSEAMAKEWSKGPKIVAAVINGVAYLRLPGMHVYTQQQIDYCANWLADSVRSLAAQKPRGWIVDLRLNTGGHILPMMAGLASFFDEGPLSYYLDKDGKAVSHAAIQNRNYVQEDSLWAKLKTLPPDLCGARVAVLIGRGTGSSAEGLAFNFKYRNNSRLFGENSAGAANATEGFLFNDKQSYFLLTTSALATRDKRALPATVEPDEVVVHNDRFESIDTDNAVAAALTWLGKGR